MNGKAISVEGISKRYRIGALQSARTFREALVDAVTAPFKRGRNGQGDVYWALEDLSFEVQHGEAVGIIGRNGAGKSTLLKILSRITEPSSGQARIYGRVGSLLEVGTGFHPELTGRENVYLSGAILGMKRREIHRQFDEIVDFAEVERFIDTPVKHFSSGMYVRLAFAVAAHLEPEILIVDEVLAVGDASFQRKCLGKMKEAGNSGRTVLFVSHNMTAIRSLCTRAALLESGRLTAIGDTETVVAQYDQVVPQGDTEVVWQDQQQAPGNDKIRLRSARLIVPDGARKIDVQTPVDVEIEIWNLQPRATLNFSLVVYTNDGTCAFNTASTPQPYTRGLLRGTCRIPGRFLNDMIYRLRILVVQEGRVVFDEANVLALHVSEGNRAGPWHGKWIGTVRPALEWKLEQIEGVA